METHKLIHVPVVLKGVNYLLWARTVKTTLCSHKGYWSHVVKDRPVKEDLSSDEEEASEEEDEWFQIDQIVLSIIRNSLDPPILEGYSYCETAKELWITLKNVYGNISNLTRVFEVKKALVELVQNEMEFTEYFGKFRSLWAELDMLRPNTMDPQEIRARSEQDKVFGLLLNLNPSYNELVKHILRMDRLPSLDSVCAQIQKEQGSIGLVGARGNTGLLMANKGKFEGRFEDRKKLFCDHCKKKGHIKEKCWLLHPHLKPAKFKGPQEPRANVTQEALDDQVSTAASTSTSKQPEIMTAQTSSFQGEVLKRADLEALINTLKSLKESGISLYSHNFPKPFIVDSGASHHMISDPSLISNIKPSAGSVVIANGHRIAVSGVGNLDLFEKESKAFLLPEFTSNLLSVRKAVMDLNCYVRFGPNDVIFQDIKTGSLLGKGGVKDGLYILEDPKTLSILSSVAVSNSAVSSLSSSVWHARIGHPHSRALEIMLPSVSFDNVDCEACILGKHCKSVFPLSSTIYENCFDLVHSDVWTSPCASRENHRYFVTFIDEKSKYTWLTLMPSKDRVFDAFKNFENYITNQFNAKLKVLRTDNGGEYMGKAFQEHLSKQGILHQTSCPYNPQQNGVAERKNRHLMEITRSIMFHMNVPKRFWGDAVTTASYLINRTPTRVLKDASPYEVLNKTKPPLDHLRVFGCVCFVLVPGELRNKLEAKSKKCMFIGYSTTQKGYKCLDPETRRVYVSRDVKFLEDRSYYGDKNWDQLKDLPEPALDRAASLKYLLRHLGVQTAPNEPENRSTRSSESDPEVTDPVVNQDVQSGRIPRTAGQQVDCPNESQHVPRTVPHTSEQQSELRSGQQSGRATHDPDSDQDDDEQSGQRSVQRSGQRSVQRSGRATCDPDDDQNDDERSGQRLVQRSGQSNCDRNGDPDSDPDNDTNNHPVSDQPSTSMPSQQLRRSTRIRKDPSNWRNTRVYYNSQAVAHPHQTVYSVDLLPSEFHAFLGKIALDQVPESYEEAKQTKEWMEAVKDETNAMVRNHTWDEADLPPGKKAVTSKWVFTIKYKSNGDIERYKARLVARGFTQTYGVDYTDTFAPVAKLHTVRVVLSVATNLCWDLWQMDVKNAFLQGELAEEVYMTPPSGLENEVTPGKVLRLRKAIYGLKQSPRAWYHKLSLTLRNRGFKKSEADHTLFTLKGSQGIVVVLIYVDDLIITGDDREGIAATKSYLQTVFDIKDLGELRYFLGIEIGRSSEGLFLSQKKYTLDLLNETGMIGCKPAKTPLEDGYKVNRKGEKHDEPFEDIQQYRRLVGKLIYLTITRPDICFAVNQVSQHMQSPSKYHWIMIERILKYLKGSSGQGVWMGKNASTDVSGYCDADWAGDRNDRKSITGYCTFIGGNLVTWKSKKQKVVACSSAEAEYRAMRRLTDELVWLKALLKDLGREFKDPIPMHCDNQAAIHIANNSVFHERTKHVEVDCHKVRERIAEGVTLPCYTPSKDQLADIFTKAASLKVCNHIYSKLGLVSLDRP